MLLNRLSINVNKFALIRNSRGANNPNILAIASQCLEQGAHGITVHPRPDQRHIRYDDLSPLKDLVKAFDDQVEFNIEGYPSDDFLDLLYKVRPDQVTFVPDPPGALTSSFGWDVIRYFELLGTIVENCKELGIRTSLFIDHDFNDLDILETLSPDRVELYTHYYAHHYAENRSEAIAPYKEVASKVTDLGIGLNAGHDLNLDNLGFFLSEIPNILEVSIGHALVCDALQFGLDDTIRRYLECLPN